MNNKICNYPCMASISPKVYCILCILYIIYSMLYENKYMCIYTYVYSSTLIVKMMCLEKYIETILVFLSSISCVSGKSYF